MNLILWRHAEAEEGGNDMKRALPKLIPGSTAVGVTTKVLGGLKPAAPSVERAQVWMDTVKRGPMLRQVRGLGTLVPIDGGLVIPAETDGRVDQRLALPGTIVTPGTVLLVLSNPELEQATIDAEWKVKAAEAELNNLKVKLQSDRLTQQAAAATVETDSHTARLEADRDAELSRNSRASRSASAWSSAVSAAGSGSNGPTSTRPPS